jgi:DNA-binding SARP family transcriptional activator
VPETSEPAGRGNVVALPREYAPDPAPGPGTQLNVLGGFSLLIDGELVDVSLTGQRLMGLLACRGRQATRSQIAYVLWPDSTNQRALANLRTALHRISRKDPPVLRVTSRHVELAPDVAVDLEHATELAARLLSSTGLETEDDAFVEDVLAANLYADLLPDWDEEWLPEHQTRYRQLRLTALEALSGQLAAIGHHGGSVQAAMAAVQADPLRDSAHESLIRAHLAQGNPRMALAHYRTYRGMLRQELGIDPPASIDRLLPSA